MDTGREPNSITYWESRQINIGDYENISFGATNIVKFTAINNKEGTVTVNSSEHTKLYPPMTETQALEQAQNLVRKLLDTREKDIRIRAHTNGGTNYDPLKKGQDFGIIDNEDLGITAEDINPGKHEELKQSVTPKTKTNELDPDFEDWDEAPKPVTTKKPKPKIKKPKKDGLFADNPPDLDTTEEIPT